MREDVASMNLTISHMTLADAKLDSLALLRIMRVKEREAIRELIPGVRIHWVFARSAPRSYTLQAIASRDDARALFLANRMRRTRREWQGYRTDLDWMEDTRSGGWMVRDQRDGGHSDR